ncbi:succinyl-CoA--3-ketoacid-CoA transferase [Microbacterium sp. Root61]|uniref:3-oxoacid CoA-transferase subunit B n=1 Tax=Microbacterium sp. Root61 TaxID=1736570 RepID=UPI0006F501A8|nr:3-oxoacid CoA-transferase subunit B [Microbacterium sp. Root61]KRA24314.1 succinyl-CoA--3-ketoacid-CoA transferase [Microbacterium sp. Root61]
MIEAAAPALLGRTRDEIAQRLAADLSDGYTVNLGVGIPLAVPKFIPDDIEVVLHAENGVLGLGGHPGEGNEDPDLTDAGKQPASLISGGAITDSALSFAIIRGGHLDVTILGALQVSQSGDLANWYVPGRNPAVGGAMDLVAGTREVWVCMEHVDRDGQPKIVPSCTFPLTGHGVVTRVYTDLAIFHVVDRTLVLVECAPGITRQDVRARTTAAYTEELDS